ncbi:MAG: TetR family transcriptional regulator, partial [Rhizomicrobium sp.]
MLLETARALVAREGEAAFSLGSLADEAGLARATIYGFFSGKRDLIAALEAEGARPGRAEDEQPASDSKSGPEVRGIPPRETEPKPVDEATEHPLEPVALEEGPIEASSVPEDGVGEFSEETAQSAIGNAGPVLSGEPAPQESEAVSGPSDQAESGHHEIPELIETGANTDVAVREDEPEALTPFEEGRRVHAAHLEEIAKRLILPESALKEGTNAVISRLETRLRVLEKSIAGLETRQNVLPDETAKKLKPVSDLVAQLQTRADALEDRHRQALAELRLNIHELSAKQGALETVHDTTGPEVAAWQPISKTQSQPVEKKPAEDDEETPTDNGEENSKATYLSTARHLAKEGARQAAERQIVEEEETRARRRRLMTAVGVAASCLVVVGVLFEMKPSPHGVSVARSKSVASAAQPKMQASRAPLDRLTALANKGDARAELVIGLKYLKGDGAAENDKEASRWFQSAAQAGDPVAENLLARYTRPDAACPSIQGLR